MVLTELLDEMLELTIFSSYIKNEKPISLLLVASPEAGKTRLVMRYKQNQGLVYLTDCTASGILDDYKVELGMGNIKHLIFTDLITPLAKNPDTRNSFIAFLNGLVEDGILEVHTRFNHHSIPLLKPVGIIGCIAPNPLEDNRRHWKNIGFMSRMIPFSWSYSKDSIKAIEESIQYQQYHEDKPIVLELPVKTTSGEKSKVIPDYYYEAEIELEPELSGRLSGIAEILSERVIKNEQTGQLEENQNKSKNSDNPYGFRLTKQLHTLAKASALKDKRSKVTEKDIEKIKTLSSWMNLKYNEI
jgi:hypothetical protein